MQKIFKIEIKQNYNLVYSLISRENQEIIQQEEVTPCILFNKNTIELFQESDNSIHFLQKWAENPENFNTYGIEFQNKSYELLPEVLFAIVINEIKKKYKDSRWGDIPHSHSSSGNDYTIKGNKNNILIHPEVLYSADIGDTFYRQEREYVVDNSKIEDVWQGIKL